MQHYVWKILGLLLGNAEIPKSGSYICLIWYSVLMFVLTKRQLIQGHTPKKSKYIFGYALLMETLTV